MSILTPSCTPIPGNSIPEGRKRHMYPMAMSAGAVVSGIAVLIGAYHSDFVAIRCVGKTLCLGTRLAKVELKLLAAMFVLGFRHSVIDRNGADANPLPAPNWNDILLCRPPKGSFNLRYERTSVPL